MSNENFKIYVTNNLIGCNLSLKVLENKSYSSWAVKDSFNGLTREVSIDSTVEGFFRPNSVVDLYIFDSKHNCNIVKNVKIYEKETEVSLDV